MSEHIKTTKEICLSCYPCDEKDKWVSLSWLKEQIEKELKFILSFLEEK